MKMHLLTFFILLIGALPSNAVADGSAVMCAMDEPTGSRPLAIKASCMADCGNGITRSCPAGTVSCEGRDSVCPGFRGYVQCGSTRQYCPTCPVPDCSQDAICNLECSSDPDCPEWCPVNGCNYIYNPTTQCCEAQRPSLGCTSIC
jgi:hypothetical protein